MWTGSRMIVQGGFGDSGLLSDGASYDPATDSWTAIAQNLPPVISVEVQTLT